MANARDLRLGIIKDSGPVEVEVDSDGYFTVGTGVWRAPWQNDLRIVAVYDSDTMFWEGLVKVPVVGGIELPLTDGYPKKPRSE